MRVQPHGQRLAVGRRTSPTRRDHYVFGRTRPDDRGAHRARQLHDDAEPVAAALRASRSCRRGDYGAFKELVDGRNPDYGARYAPFAYALDADDDPNFNVKSFRTTNVLRWEYKPGSTLFVVWQQARENDAVPGGFRFGRDMHDIFGVAPRNVFLVKLAYWLNY